MAKELNKVKVVKVADGKEWNYVAFGNARTNNVGHGFFAVVSHEGLDMLQTAGYKVVDEESWVSFVTECIKKATELAGATLDMTGLLENRGEFWVTKDDRAKWQVYQNDLPYTPAQTRGALRKEQKILENAALVEQKAIAKATAIKMASEAMEAKLIPAVADVTLDDVKEEQIITAIKSFIEQKVPELKIKRDLAMAFGTGNSKRLYEMVVPPVAVATPAPVKNLFE